MARRGSGAQVEDAIRAVGGVLAIVRDRHGRFVRVYRIRNKTNNNARAIVTNWLAGTSNITGSPGAQPGPSQMQLGTGTGTPAPTDTGLFTATAGTLIAVSGVGTYQTFYAQYTGFWSAPPANNYSEAGLFDAAGNLWAHVLLQTSANQPYIPISTGQTLTILWKINVLGN